MEQHFGWIEMVFSGVLVMGFGIWQLWSVNREIAKDRAAKQAAEPEPVVGEPAMRGSAVRESATRSGHPVGEHELDDR